MATPLRNLRVPDDLWTAAKARAAADGTTLSAVLVQALRDYLTPPGEESSEQQLFTRRQYLTSQAILDGASVWTAMEAVASTAIEHPDWDMEEERPWAVWEARDGRRPW